MLKKEITKRQLISAYKELDKVVGIDPPIEYEDLSMEVFAKELHETADELVEPGDEFTEQTQGIFNQLKEQIESGVEEEPKEPEESKKQVDEAEEVDKSEEEPKEQYADEKEEEEPKKEEKIKAKKEGKKTKKKESKPKNGRAENFAEIFNKEIPLTKDEYIQKMVELYPKKTNTDVPARVHFGVYSKLLLVLGYMKKTNDGKYVKVN